MNETRIIEMFRSAGQGQVFAFWDRLTPPERARLISEASEVDLAEVSRLSATLVSGAGTPVDLEGLVPAPYVPLPANGGSAADWARARALGEDALRQGRVAAFTVAGGQGTRLGFDGPKGTFPVTPVKGKSLFQVFAEKIRAASGRYGSQVPWLVMTSHQNHAATEDYFERNGHFGLDPSLVRFFRQGRMPAVDRSGRILLESCGSIALSPDGHGGSLRALERSGSLAWMEERGIDMLSYFQVDNPLVRAIDPAFVGWHLLSGSEMSSKTVPKAYPEEKLGHFCLRSGRLEVVEYSDLPVEMQRQVEPDGRLRFRAGSIAIHILDRRFAARMASQGRGLAFHRAEKRIATVDASGQPVRPAAPNGIKFEMFVFDALAFARNPLVLETDRADDFSPVKNAQGVDSPLTCRNDQLRQVGRWLRAAGAEIPVDSTGLPAFPMEVSPLFACDAEAFAGKWRALSPKPALEDGLYLE